MPQASLCASTKTIILPRLLITLAAHHLFETLIHTETLIQMKFFSGGSGNFCSKIAGRLLNISMGLK